MPTPTPTPVPVPVPSGAPTVIPLLPSDAATVRDPGSRIGPREVPGPVLRPGVPPVPGTPRNAGAPDWPGIDPGMPDAVWQRTVPQQPGR